MPIGPYKDFSSCLSAKRREGLSDEAAHRYCGALEQRAGGAISSYDMAEHMQGIMSFPPQEEKKDNGNGEKVELATTDAETVAQFVVDAAADVMADPEAPAELKEEAAEAVKVIEEEFQPEKEEVPA